MEVHVTMLPLQFLDCRDAVCLVLLSPVKGVAVDTCFVTYFHSHCHVRSGAKSPTMVIGQLWFLGNQRLQGKSRNDKVIDGRSRRTMVQH